MTDSPSRESPMFRDGLAIEQTGWRGGKAVWTTLRTLHYNHEDGTVVIPEEFITDLASVPRLPIAWLVAGGRGNRAAVLHDFAYQFSVLLYEQGRRRAKTPVTRRAADRIFREALKADPWGGTNAVTRFIMWSAVRLLGLYAYRGKKRARELNPIWTAEGLPTDPHEGES
ncbi:MAG: DUF1353 domain-containing protein [Actinomycetota bacterium]|nr:DUF1353 domain-containing protein [Actinomycetota bacterium]